MSSLHSPHLTLEVAERDHVQGPAEAPVTLLEYGDFECPHCREAHPVVKALQANLGDQLRFVFRNFPLTTVHPHAMHAAEAAEGAGAQGRFWEMHDLLFEHQRHLDDEHLLEYAQTLGLDATRFAEEMQAHAYSPRVQEDFRSGIRSGVNGTPTFFINGVRHNGAYALDVLREAISRVMNVRP